MTNLLEVLGSFAMVWIVLWFACAAVLAMLYPLFRQQILRWHPALASNLLLLFLAFPFLLGFSSTLLLFTPSFPSLVSVHCHEDCAAHMPIIATPGLAPLGLLLIAAFTALLLYRLVYNLQTSKRLRKQLEKMSAPHDGYQLLDATQPVVFTLGWWRNQIYVTRGLRDRCSRQDMAVILAHETAHSRRHDNLRLLIANLFTLVLPRKLSHKLLEDLHLMIESACDFSAAEQFGDLDVAETLLRVQKLSPAHWNIESQVVLSHFTGAEIEQRIMALVQGRSTTLLQHAGLQLSLLLLVAASFSLVEPLHHSVEILLGLP